MATNRKIQFKFCEPVPIEQFDELWQAIPVVNIRTGISRLIFFPKQGAKDGYSKAETKRHDHSERYHENNL
ncbi:MAG TPA: hypothetical protein VGM98_00480 [Schlesneria sp.]